MSVVEGRIDDIVMPLDLVESSGVGAALSAAQLAMPPSLTMCYSVTLMHAAIKMS